jgi:hypothetical protein
MENKNKKKFTLMSNTCTRPLVDPTHISSFAMAIEEISELMRK